MTDSQIMNQGSDSTADNTHVNTANMSSFFLWLPVSRLGPQAGRKTLQQPL